MATTLVHATNWTINDWVLVKRAAYNCGSCSKVNLKAKVFYQFVRGAGREPLVLSQCKWCGDVNGFYSNGRPIVVATGQ